MIRVSRLKLLLSKVPDEAHLWAYDGEGEMGISIESGDQYWFIQAWEGDGEDHHTEGFEKPAIKGSRREDG